MLNDIKSDYLGQGYVNSMRKPMSEETKHKISVKRKLQIPPMLGKTHSKKTIKKMRISAIKRGGIPYSVIMAGANARRGKHAWNYGKPAEWASGEKSIWWRGGITPESAKRTRTIEWKQLRRKIYERDNWTCQVCGEKVHRHIQCHHIIPHAISQDDSPENLITLCVKCHRPIELWGYDIMFERRFGEYSKSG